MPTIGQRQKKFKAVSGDLFVIYYSNLYLGRHVLIRNLTFTLCLFIIILVQFGLLCGHLLGNGCPLGHCILSVCNINLFPVLVLGAGFAF